METDGRAFGTVKKGRFRRHATVVPPGWDHGRLGRPAGGGHGDGSRRPRTGEAEGEGLLQTHEHYERGGRNKGVCDDADC